MRGSRAGCAAWPGRRPTGAPATGSDASASPRWPIGRRTGCRAARPSGRASPGPSPPCRRCCFSTSPSRRWTPRRARRCSTTWGGSSARPGPRRSWSRTTGPRRCGSGIAWRSSSRGGWPTSGCPERVFGAPGSEAVARFVGVENLLPGRVLAHADGLIEVEVGPARVIVAGEARPGERVLVGLRPEDLTLAPPEVARADERPEPSGRPHRPRHAARPPLAGGRRLRGAAHRARDAPGRPDARARAGRVGRGDVQGDGRPSRPARRESIGVRPAPGGVPCRTGPGAPGLTRLGAVCYKGAERGRPDPGRRREAECVRPESQTRSLRWPVARLGAGRFAFLSRKEGACPIATSSSSA